MNTYNPIHCLQDHKGSSRKRIPPYDKDQISFSIAFSNIFRNLQVLRILSLCEFSVNPQDRRNHKQHRQQFPQNMEYRAKHDADNHNHQHNLRPIPRCHAAYLDVCTGKRVCIFRLRCIFPIRTILFCIDGRVLIRLLFSFLIYLKNGPRNQPPSSCSTCSSVFPEAICCSI